MFSKFGTKLFSVGVLSMVLLAGSAAPAASARGRFYDNDRYGHNSSSFARGFRDGYRAGFRDGREDGWRGRRGRRESQRRFSHSAYDRGFAVAYERGYSRGFQSTRWDDRRDRDDDWRDRDGRRDRDDDWRDRDDDN